MPISNGVVSSVRTFGGRRAAVCVVRVSNGLTARGFLGRGVAAALFLGVLLSLLAPLKAQADVYGATFKYASVTLDQTGLLSPQAMVRDASGNLFFTDFGGGAIYELPFSNGGYGAAVTVLSNLNGPSGLAIDSSGNLYYAETKAGKVSELPLSSGTYGAPQSIATLASVEGVAVDSSGNLYVTAISTVYKLTYSSGSYGSPVAIANNSNGLSSPVGLAFDSGGDLFIADFETGNISEMKNSGGTLGAPTVVEQADATAPQFLYVDANNNLFYTNYNSSSAVYEVPWNSGSYGAQKAIEVGVSFNSQVVTDSVGNIYVTSNGNPYQVVEVLDTVNFGSIPVASSSTTLTLNFQIANGTPVKTISVVSEGATNVADGNAEFVNAGGGSCTAKTYTTATPCTLNESFSPQ
jgi:hypothetical protein